MNIPLNKEQKYYHPVTGMYYVKRAKGYYFKSITNHWFGVGTDTRMVKSGMNKGFIPVGLSDD